MPGGLPGIAACRPSSPSRPACEVAAAIEGVLIGAIASAENRSWRSPASSATIGMTSQPLELRADPFGRFQIQQDPRPGDPDFMPNEYATGVVVDRRGLILTNFHVLGEDSDLYVTTADRQVYPAQDQGGRSAQRSGRLADRGHRPGADQVRRRQQR